MLAQRATRALRSPLAKPPLPRPTLASRSLATVPRPARLFQVPWKAVGLLGGAAIAYAAWQVQPEWVPMQQLLYADAPVPVGIYKDPTTSTPFPSRLTSPDGTQLRLVGTGVRTVSFLNIKVYAVGFYVSETELQWAKDGKIAGWEGFTPERLIPPFGIPPGEPDRPKGELLIESLLEKADAAIVIIALRNTSLPHLRDGFTRAITARMQIPRVSNEFTDNMSERTGAALVEFKSFFPSKTLQKGLPLEVYYSARDRTTLFQIRNEQSRRPEVLGTLREPLLSRELIVSYFSDTAAPSRELVTSSAMGFSGEARGEPGDRDVGNDASRPAETKGIHLHHLCLRIKDPKVTLPFFREVLGMRTLFTYNAGSFSIYYMYHGDEENDETEKVWADFPNQKGLVELIHRHGSENEDFSYASGHHPTEPALSGFGHLGLVVDDVPALVQRAKKYGCKIIKEQGVSSAETVGWPNGTPQPIQAYNELYSNMAMIESPDGYWLECVPRVLEKH